MKQMKQILLTKLAKALESVTDGYYGSPNIELAALGPGVSLSWDPAPFEWTAISEGSSLYAAGFGDYSLPLEAEIAAVVEEIKAKGYRLEANNNWQLSIYRS